jgi:hypothetical protein
MHENIKRLAEEAGFVVWDDEAHNPGEVVDWACSYDKELAKIVELTARECAELFKLTYTDEQYARRIDKTILKHFGLYPE